MCIAPMRWLAATAAKVARRALSDKLAATGRSPVFGGAGA
jgi:hypothetical protein